jgi:superfamily II DNA or RNA helicase
MEGALAELSRQLLGCADPKLLDAPLDVCCSGVADEAARELLVSLYEAGSASRLRELLEDDKLARWASERCTAREEESLCAQLRDWLGGHGRAPDDPERLVSLEPPPLGGEELFAWAERHGVARLLMSPAREHVATAEGLWASATLLECCLGQSAADARGASLLAQGALADEARARLYGLAARNASLAARSALHMQPLPSGTLGLLARRLRALCADHALQELHRHSFVPARPVALDPESGTCRAALRASDEAWAPREVELQLSGFEQRSLAARCDGCAASDCVHVAAVAARLFEACQQREDRLHAALSSFASVPSWRRFLAALAPAHEAPGQGAVQVVFSLRLTGQRLTVGALLRRTHADGRTTPGKLSSAQTLARSPYASDLDHAPLSALAARSRTLSPQYVAADLAVLRSLVEHPAVELDGADVRVRVSEEHARVSFVEQPEGVVPSVAFAGETLAYHDDFATTPYAVKFDRDAGALTFCALTPPLLRLLRALTTFRGVLPPESYPALAPWLSGLRKSAQLSLPTALDGIERPAPKRLLLRLTPRLDEGVDLTLTVRALALAPLWSPGQGPELVHGLVEGVHSSVRRDLAAERATAQVVIEALGLARLLALGPYAFRAEGTQAALAVLSAAARASDLLEIEWAERARALRVAATVRQSTLKVSLFKRGEWCALGGGAQLGERLVPIERLLEAARQGERFVPIGGSDYAEIEQTLFERLDNAQLCTLPRARELGLTAAALPLFREQLGAAAQAGDAESAAWIERAAQAQATEPSPPLPALALDLRAYQQQGAAWLLAQSRWAPGACLADEMGLGKTAQSIALLAARAEHGPALVLAPTSVVEGWLRELARFAPWLRAARYGGENRPASLSQLAAGSVLVASYDLLLRDRTHFEELAFATLIMDEAQWLKNARTRRARAVATLHAQFRVALTGTPVENRLADLWSLFELVAPGLLGSWSLFRARFAVPIERYENRARASALRALISPLMLRRTKSQVAGELPPRTDIVHSVELSQAERELYAGALEHARRALGKRKRRPDDTSRSVQILAELTRLRQLACHPRLVLGDSRVSSSKMRALLQLLEDLVPRGHRVLLFSQFVRHLELVREAVEKRAMSYVYLDGQTPPLERTRRIDAFQRGEASLFLISLKAGGTGLNLTAADYVVHLDPWWNPAAEDQASDRAHRIGQQRPVTVVRLVAQGTIEERVLGLHEHKRQLAASILDEQSAQPLPAELGVEQLEALLVE